MFRFWPVICILAISAPLSAQETTEPAFKAETILALKGLQLLDQRLHAVGYRLVSANEPFCRTKVAGAGLLLHDINQYGDQAAARFALGFDGPVAINAVAEDSPAANTGLAPGNDLFVINNVAIADIAVSNQQLDSEVPAYRRLAAVNAALKNALNLGQTQLTVSVGGIRQIVTVDPVQTCPSRFQISVSDDRSASADGRMVSISSALAQYFQSDDEFAAVTAHELAHNLLNHKDRLNEQNVNRGFFGQFGKSAGRIKETEIEADRLSVWLMANAGYDPQAAIRFWTRYGKEHGKGIFSASTHYKWKKRVMLFEDEIKKLEALKPVNGKYAPPLLVSDER